MRLESFSEKQKIVLTWWCDGSPSRELEAIICDGAVRSGKTICMGLSFVCWAMRRFQGERFGLCGKTVGGAAAQPFGWAGAGAEGAGVCLHGKEFAAFADGAVRGEG